MKQDRYLSIGEAASLLDISIATLRRWEDEGKLSPLRTLSGQRRYRLDELQNLKAPETADQLLTIKQSAKRMCVSPKTVRRLVYKGALRPYDQGKNRRLLFLQSELDKIRLTQTQIPPATNLANGQPKLATNNGLVTVKQAANSLGVSEKTIRRLVAKGKLHPAEKGRYGTLLFLKKEVEKLLQGSRQATIETIHLPPSMPPANHLVQTPVSKLISANMTAIFLSLLLLIGGLTAVALLTPASTKQSVIKKITNLAFGPGLLSPVEEEGEVPERLASIDIDALKEDLKDEFLIAIQGDTVPIETFFVEGITVGSQTLTIDNSGALTTTEAITTTNTSASSLTIGGGLVAGTGSVYIIDRSGRIPALTNTYIADLDASKLTGKIDNADHLDGISSSSFLRSDESDDVRGAMNFTATPGGNGVGGGPVYINPGSATYGYTLFGVALNDSLRFKVDAEGDTTVAGTLGVTGATILSSTLGVTDAITASSTLAVAGDSTLTGDLAVNGGDLTTSSTTFNLVNTTATTLNLGGAATTVSLGAATGTTTVNNNLAVSGTLAVTGNATFSSDVTVSSGGQLSLSRIPTQAHTGTWSIGAATWNEDDATIYVNPSSATADSNIFALAVGGSVKFDVDAEGDVYANNLILEGNTTQSTSTITGDLSVEGNTTLGDATTDTLTFNPATLTWQGGDKTIDVTGDATRTLTILNSTASQVANVVISDGQLQIPTTGSGAGILIGGDTQLYRSAADTLYTPDTFIANAGLEVNGTITLANDETISNATNGLVDIGGDVDISGNLTIGGSATPVAGQGIRLVPNLSSTNSYGMVTSPVLATGVTTGYIYNGGFNVGNFTMTTGYGLYLGTPYLNDTGIITASYGIRIENQNAGGTDTYGLSIGDQTGAGNNYGLTITGADTYALWVGSGADNIDAANGITFGSSGDTNLYRSAANVLKTDDGLTVGIDLIVDGGDIGLTADTNLLGLAADTFTVRGQADIEGYAAIGNGSALSANTTLLVDRDFTSTSGTPMQLFVRGVITQQAAANVYTQYIAGDGITVDGAITVPTVTSLRIDEPNLTLLNGAAVTNAASLYVNGAPTEAGTGNYALWVDAGDVRFDADLQVQGGDLTTTAATFNLVNATATTLNLGGAATALNIGAGSGTLTFAGSTITASSSALALGGAVSGATTITGSGNINTTGGAIQTNSVTRIDNSGNITANTVTITTSSGTNQTFGNNMYVSTTGTDELTVYDNNNNAILVFDEGAAQ